MTEIKRPMLESDWEDDDEEESTFVSTFIVDDDAKAEWCLGKIREIEKSQQMWLDFYNSQIDRVKKHHDRVVDRMKLYLRRYLVMQREKGLVKSTKLADKYTLPSGVLTLKRGGWDYNRDDTELLDWLRQANMTNYIKETPKYTPMWGELKKLTKTDDNGNIVLAETGEVVHGVKAVMAPDSFEIK